MGKIHWSGLALALACVAGASAKEAPRAVDVWLHGAIAVDAQGRVTALEWDQQPKLQAMLAERVAPAIRQWEFVPATVDGQPAETRTGVFVHVQADAAADGSLALRFLDARTGPMAVRTPPPRYPDAAIRAGASAQVRAEVVVAADGSAQVRELHYEGSDAHYRKAFLSSVEDTMARWTFRPELVAGHATQTPVAVPVQFCVDPMQWCREQAAKPELAGREGLPEDAYIGSGALALRTRIEAQRI
ncbi:MAG TPA: energy transducer TonB [Luteimonas sp.]|nr:energy transducer TonB [Luteimonas sp.]